METPNTTTETTTENTIKSRIESTKYIDVNLFYTVSFSDTTTLMQGFLTAKNRLYCEDLGFEFELTKYNWLEAYKDGIKIVLTFN